MTSCSEVEEKRGEEDATRELPRRDGQDLGCFRGYTSTPKLGKNLLVYTMRYVSIWSLPCSTQKSMLTKSRVSKMPIQYASCNMAATFTEDDLLLGSKPHNHPLFVNR